MSRLWGRMIKKHKISAQAEIPCAWGEEKQALVEMCKRFDIPAPIWLGKHEREFEEFRHTAFARDHFVEDVPFDRLEIEFLDDNTKKRKSDDPRNAF